MYYFGRFRYWCQKVLPLVYDDSLSYYEVLCKLMKHISDMLNELEKMGKDLTDLQALYVELKNYVDHYFDSADFAQLVNDKLDEMAENGTLEQIILNAGSVVRYYDSFENIQQVSEGAVVFVDGEKYIVSAENNGYGVEVDGLYLNKTVYEPQPVGSSILTKNQYLSKISGGSPYTVLQGGCYDSTNNRYAFWFDQPDDTVSGELVFTDSNFNVIARHAYNIKHINDLTWCPDKNKYVGACIYGDYAFYEFGTDGSIGNPIMQVDGKGVSTISWDDVNKVFVGSTRFYVIVFDDEYNILHEAEISAGDRALLIPNNTAYTSVQGAVIVNEQLYYLSSVFYADDYMKSGFRVCQVNTVDGSVTVVHDGFYPRRGTEAECITANGDEIICWGYNNFSIEGAVLTVGAGNSGLAPSISTYDIYYNDSGIDGDGLTPQTPTNNIQNAFNMASKVNRAVIHLLSDVGTHETIHCVGESITVEADENSIEAIIACYGGVILRINEAVIVQQGADDAIYNTESTVLLSDCTLVGHSDADRFMVNVNGARCELNNVQVEGCKEVARCTTCSIIQVNGITGDDTGYITGCYNGGISCVNTRSGLASGFTMIGVEYGGKIILAKTGDVYDLD